MSSYDIHIHLPDDAQAGAQACAEQVGESKEVVSPWTERLLERIGQCYDWKSFYELGEDFQQIGLAIRETQGARLVLCRLEEGRPVLNDIIDDYIFIGDKDGLDEEITQRGLEVITRFVESNAGRPQRLIVAGQDYAKDMSLYGKPLRLYSEDALAEQQQICHMGRLING